MPMFRKEINENDGPALHTREELHQLLGNKIVRPESLSFAAYRALSETDRSVYDHARIEYMNRSIVVKTPQLDIAKRATNKYFAKNYGNTSGNRGLIVSGGSTLGKTTMMKAIMQWTFSTYRRQVPDFAEHGKTPIVYVEVPSGSTGKSLMSAFAHFFGITVAPRSDTLDAIQHRVVSAMKASNTQLVIVDEVHNLSAKNRGNGESIQILKALHNMVPATFIYAGIQLDESDLFKGPLGSQISGRFSELKLGRYSLATPEGNQEWLALVRAFDSVLPLADHKPGLLVKHASYLHDRTGGSIGSLRDLLVGSAIDLILDDETLNEAITKELLDAQLLDIAAERHYTAVRTRRATSRRSKKA